MDGETEIMRRTDAKGRPIHAVNAAGKPVCGANPKDPCQSTIRMRNGRCRVHGGEATGPYKNPEQHAESMRGNSNAKTHGLYRNVLKGRALEVYEEARDLTGKELAKDNATLLAGNLAEAMDEPEELPGARGAVLAFIDWCNRKANAFPGVEVPMPKEVAEASFGYEVGSMLKRRIYQPALNEQAKVVAAITKAAEFADKKEEGQGAQDVPQGAGVLVLPSKEEDETDVDA